MNRVANAMRFNTLLRSGRANQGQPALRHFSIKTEEPSSKEAYNYLLEPLRTKQSDVMGCFQRMGYFQEYSSLTMFMRITQPTHPVSMLCRNPRPGLLKKGMEWPSFLVRHVTTMGNSKESSEVGSAASPDIVPRIKFKRLDKTAKHIMQILDKEAVEEVRTQREILDIRPGYIIQLKVEVPENKRRASILKGIVIARRNAGLNSTFRLRRLVAGVGVESVFPLYSPNIKEIKVLDKKKVRRAKLYYLRDKMNALKKH
ncbi:50S ribosomal protein L19-1, chloroplastic-like [Macadamia integrifolia]|uniref:50S ribosomal protein L19-1, chloroplastic-like n=1 Tax=Macadamia integrifolia TaxID=60698 RepID=UPI001C4F677D|nr:50S ribosomal protein L19-1, chloroplastic-like [Macadamia integrifolia]XP_042496109.1 50S ribosomal protein L19-1, chloroplastic-like [Macadamia integrifolia]